jgi:cell division protein FtsA
MVPPEEMLAVSGVGGRADREISRHVLASMIEPRMEEIFALANKEVSKNHFAALLGGGVVLTGGSSLLPGVTELAERVFAMPARLGVPRGLGAMSAQVEDPRFSTGVGLVLQAAKPEGGQGMYSDNSGKQAKGKLDIWNWFASRF